MQEKENGCEEEEMEKKDTKKEAISNSMERKHIIRLEKKWSHFPVTLQSILTV